MAGGVRVQVRVQPKARSAGIKGIADETDGTVVLKVAVTAPPEDGKANDAVVKLLARECRVAARDVSVVAGATARRKVIEIAGDPARLMDDLRRVVSAAAAKAIEAKSD
ncbi:MAG TPA: DUF167 domain-containing protein [Stellaceae bacterium]